MIRGDSTLLHILAPIEDALNHAAVTDIVVNKPHEVGVRLDGAWQWRDAPSFDFVSGAADEPIQRTCLATPRPSGSSWVTGTVGRNQRSALQRPPPAIARYRNTKQ